MALYKRKTILKEKLSTYIFVSVFLYIILLINSREDSELPAPNREVVLLVAEKIGQFSLQATKASEPGISTV